MIPLPLHASVTTELNFQSKNNLWRQTLHLDWPNKPRPVVVYMKGTKCHHSNSLLMRFQRPTAFAVIAKYFRAINPKITGVSITKGIHAVFGSNPHDIQRSFTVRRAANDRSQLPHHINIFNGPTVTDRNLSMYLLGHCITSNTKYTMDSYQRMDLKESLWRKHGAIMSHLRVKV